MNTGKYIPPNMRNANHDEKPRNNSYQNNRRPYRKSKWELDEEDRQSAEKKKIEEEEYRKRNCEVTDTNFPSLGNPPTKMSVWGGTKSFAAMAAEWDEKKKNDDIEKLQQKREEVHIYHRQNIPLPHFHNIGKFVEPEDDYEDNKTTKNENTEDSGWTVVDTKKYRREKTLEERLNRPPTPENGDSVWNNDAPEEHETCWEDYS